MSLMSLMLDAVRAAFVLGAALAALLVFRRASLRRTVLVASFAAVLALPFLARALAGSAAAAPLPVVVRAALDPVVDRAEPVATTAPAPAPRAATLPTKPSASSIALAVWALGAAVVLARLAASLLRARGLVRRAVTLRRRGVRVLVSDEIDAPATAGVLAPVVLVPPDALGWSRARWRVVLSHEIAHVRARDCLAGVVGQIVCALHWFDPLAWIAARRLRRERELAADERVLALGAKASDYAGHLVAIAHGAWGGRAEQRGARSPNLRGAAPAGVVAMAERRSELALRVEAIVRAGRRALPSRVTKATLMAAALGVAFAAACTGAPADAKAPQSAEAAATTDPSLQKILDEEMPKTAAEWRATSATAVVLEPSSGAILAVYDPAASRRAYVTGSTLKAVTIGAALDVGAVRADERFDCRASGKIHDASPNGTLGLGEILAVSSNVGTAQVFDRLGAARLKAYLSRFHFGEIEVEDGERGAIVAIGERAAATPIQVAAAYAAIANGGEYVAPTVARRAPSRERVLGADTARTLMAMLEGVVEKGTAKAAHLPGVRVAGKTGTADYEVAGAERRYASFVGIVPADAPRYVILVGVETARDDASGGSAAAPAFARIAARALR